MPAPATGCCASEHPRLSPSTPRYGPTSPDVDQQRVPALGDRLQLAWVLGAAMALALPTRAVVGFSAAAAALLPVLGVVLARKLALRRTE